MKKKAKFLREIGLKMYSILSLLILIIISLSPLHAQVVSTFAGTGTNGYANGSSSTATFANPQGVAVDVNGNVYVADGNNVIRKIAGGTVSTFAGSGATGSADGTGTAATFSGPTGIALDASGNVYIGDAGNDKIRKITPAGVVTTLAVTGIKDAFGLVLDATGNLYDAEFGFYRVQKVTPAGVVSILAGNASTPGSADGTGAAATFNTTCGITADTSGNLYIADFFNNMIRKITPGGVVTTLAGSLTTGYADGTGTSATFSGPTGITADASGNLYVSDQNNQRIRKITPAGVVTTVAGSGSYGFANGTGASATFNTPRAICIDPTGSILYVADQGNNCIRKIVLPVPEIKISQSGTELVSKTGSYNFGNVNCLSNSGVISFTIDNSASAGQTLSLTNVPIVTISGTNASDFSVNTTSTNPSLAVGVSTTFTITFTPSSSGTKSATVTVLNNDIDEGKYTFTITGTGVKINQTISGLSDISKTYGDVSFNLSGSSTSSLGLTYSSSNTSAATVSGNAVTITGAGTTVITASQSGDNTYNAATNATCSLTVSKAPLTITADDKTKIHSDANPPLTLSYTGFVNGEHSSDLGCTPMIQTTATTSSAVGTYPITVSDCGYTDNNYSYTFVNGTLTITVNTAIENSSETTVLKLYPNPTLGELTVTAAKNLQVTVYNVQGMKILEQSVLEGNTTLSLEGLKSGLYLLQYTDDSGNKSEQYRIIKN